MDLSGLRVGTTFVSVHGSLLLPMSVRSRRARPSRRSRAITREAPSFAAANLPGRLAPFSCRRSWFWWRGLHRACASSLWPWRKQQSARELRLTSLRQRTVCHRAVKVDVALAYRLHITRLRFHLSLRGASADPNWPRSEAKCGVSGHGLQDASRQQGSASLTYYAQFLFYTIGGCQSPHGRVIASR